MRDIDVEVISLHDQFRYCGSEAFDEWVPRLLGLHEDEPSVWESDGRFDLRTANLPRTILYSTDAETRAFLAQRIPRNP